jgi:hypothetical protein
MTQITQDMKPTRLTLLALLLADDFDGEGFGNSRRLHAAASDAVDSGLLEAHVWPEKKYELTDAGEAMLDALDAAADESFENEIGTPDEFTEQDRREYAEEEKAQAKRDALADPDD